MNKKLLYGTLSLLLLVKIALPSRAAAELIGPTEDPIRIGVGARLMGMGKAFVGLADDGSAILTNPAGICELGSWYAMSMYSNLINEIPYTTLTYSYPFEYRGYKLAAAAGYVGTGVTDIISPTQQGFTYFDFHSQVTLLSLAGQVNPAFSVGGNLKFFDEGYSDPVNVSGKGFDLDLGLKYTLSPQASLGLNLQNILPVSMGGRLDWSNGYSESIPAIVKFGGAFRFRNDTVLLTMDNDYWLTREYPLQLHAGAEWTVNPTLILRGGFDQSVSSYTPRMTATNLTFGVGLKFLGSRLDYAYHPYHEEASTLTHFFSISFSPSLVEKPFVSPPPPPELPVTPEAAAMIWLSAPKNKLVTYATKVEFRGTYEALAALSVAGQKVRLNNDQTFAIKVPLAVGINYLLVLGFDRHDRLARQERSIIRLPVFKDVPRNYWARQTIERLAAMTIMQGDYNNKFRPRALLPAKHANPLLSKLKKLGCSNEELAFLKKRLLRKGVTRVQAAALIARTKFFKEEAKKFFALN